MGYQRTVSRIEADIESVLSKLWGLVESTRGSKETSHEEVVVAATGTVSLTNQHVLQLAGRGETGSSPTYWSASQTGTCLLALGSWITVVSNASDRVNDVLRQIQSLHIADNSSPAHVRWFGGMAFDEEHREHPWNLWPAAKFVLPKVILERVDSGWRLTLLYLCRPGDKVDKSAYEEQVRHWLQGFDTQNTKLASQPVHEHKTDVPEAAFWKDAVRITSEAIRSGNYHKMVLARYEAVPLTMTVSDMIPSVLDSLQTAYSESRTFAIWHEQECFVGASPENLVSVHGEKVTVDCLAGTTGRGKTREEDERFATDLLNSSKNRDEHEVVRNWISETLHEAGVATMHMPAKPNILRLANVQHLHTPITALRTSETSVLEFVGHLHPTPAVAGTPRDVVMPMIRNRETIDRGWYAGAIGWMNALGEGEFAVALRSALVTSGTAYLYAGAGIMGDSDEEAEWRETDLKLNTMRKALGVVKGE